MIRINLTGDYDLQGSTSTQDLLNLDAFLGALRGSVDSDKDTFLVNLSKAVALAKRKSFDKIALQVTSELVGNKLTHEFRIVEI